MRRIAVAVALVAMLLVAVRALVPEKVAAAPTVPELRSRPPQRRCTSGSCAGAPLG
jgi:hypothetical protein